MISLYTYEPFSITVYGPVEAVPRVPGVLIPRYRVLIPGVPGYPGTWGELRREPRRGGVINKLNYAIYGRNFLPNNRRSHDEIHLKRNAAFCLVWHSCTPTKSAPSAWYP
eukprot:3486061-Rhodomonas_salina.1